jgi:hypothetical protein
MEGLVRPYDQRAVVHSGILGPVGGSAALGQVGAVVVPTNELAVVFTWVWHTRLAVLLVVVLLGELVQRDSSGSRLAR